MSNIKIKKKKIKSVVSIQVTVGKATPAALGSSLGPHGINIMEFCKSFDQKSSGQELGTPIPVNITIYEDRSFEFYTKNPPVSYFLKKKAKISSGSKTPGKSIAGYVSMDDIKEIYKIKKDELNAYDEDSGVKIILGSASSMGLSLKN